MAWRVSSMVPSYHHHKCCQTPSSSILEQNPAYSSWLKQDQLLLSWLLSTVSENIIPSPTQCSTSFKLWTMLENLYSSHSFARVTLLRMQLQTAKKGNSTITDFFTKMKTLSSELASAGKEIPDDDLITFILTVLDPDYENVVVSILSQGQKPVLDEVYSILLSHEARLEHQQNHFTTQLPPEANLNFGHNKTPPGNWKQNSRGNPSRSHGRGGKNRG